MIAIMRLKPGNICLCASFCPAGYSRGASSKKSFFHFFNRERSELLMLPEDRRKAIKVGSPLKATIKLTLLSCPRK